MRMHIFKKMIPSPKGDLSIAIHQNEQNTRKLAILCPGFLDSKDYLHLVSLAESLCIDGYTVVRFDPTGTWESEGNIEDYTTTQYILDIQTVLEYMKKGGEYNEVLLGGHSRGGQVSILFAVKEKSISAVLAIMPSTGPMVGKKREEWEQEHIHISKRDLPNDMEGTREFAVPFAHVLDRDKYSAMEVIKDLHVPFICVAGGQDVIVPKEEIEELFSFAHEPKKYIFFPQIGHDYRRSKKEVEEVNKKIISVLHTIVKK
ncbi:MAG: hypothetical protein COV59_03205 [Candidatus Magasanikbacteria bacterium CG11_big_fil_rev_8_21_14_0_20_39_34]|uniref:Serine aminopeptidase S33 domain-containing protein n=1 Tax=Candidatus Magasanikbacteria bacterium CG11_big_fil_rev_8_21_14_0_20_39_34 TaxID=1974653 RepID=A0A2H0N5J5_9BACT|nr:MAG: hypothetical protein COV59_03205 [Candidatus Magasanikbacteria bacterium CG11_big_fil_rev_8_21_14_0_20_39_34]